MVTTVTLTEQENAILHTIAQQLGKDQTEILHEAIRHYIITFQQERVIHENYDSLSDSELTAIAELSFLALDEAAEEYTYDSRKSLVRARASCKQ